MSSLNPFHPSFRHCWPSPNKSEPYLAPARLIKYSSSLVNSRSSSTTALRSLSFNPLAGSTPGASCYRAHIKKQPPSFHPLKLPIWLPSSLSPSAEHRKLWPPWPSQVQSRSKMTTSKLQCHVPLIPECFVLNIHLSYESLPPNFSLLQNMAAGAFAGIAVR